MIMAIKNAPSNIKVLRKELEGIMLSSKGKQVNLQVLTPFGCQLVWESEGGEDQNEDDNEGTPIDEDTLSPVEERLAKIKQRIELKAKGKSPIYTGKSPKTLLSPGPYLSQLSPQRPNLTVSVPQSPVSTGPTVTQPSVPTGSAPQSYSPVIDTNINIDVNINEDPYQPIETSPLTQLSAPRPLLNHLIHEDQLSPPSPTYLPTPSHVRIATPTTPHEYLRTYLASSSPVVLAGKSFLFLFNDHDLLIMPDRERSF
jgi:hypothetical protein